jgi:hypothetical protein
MPTSSRRLVDLGVPSIPVRSPLADLWRPSIVCANHSNSLTDALYVMPIFLYNFLYKLTQLSLLVTSIPTRVSCRLLAMFMTQIMMTLATQYASSDRKGYSIWTPNIYQLAY